MWPFIIENQMEEIKTDLDSNLDDVFDMRSKQGWHCHKQSNSIKKE